MATEWMSDLGATGLIAVLSGVWAAIGIVSGLSAQRFSPELLARDTPITRPRSFERGGRAYEAWLRVSLWKDRLPEAGALFGEGGSKKHLSGTSTEVLRAFQSETRRAEYVHWANIAAGPAFVLIVPAWAAVFMTGFAVVVHLPFVIVQRYNRLRLDRILHRRACPARRGGE